MTRFATKFAASTMVIAIAMVGCQADTLMTSATASTSERSMQQAGRFAENARTAIQRGDLAEAVRLAERAVELSPRDAGYRMLLADVYLKNGRFRSAETSYADVIEIDQGNVRAGLSVALTQIAQGRSGDALVSLEAVQGRAPAADVGLAFALAGQPQRAIEILEPAARGAEANGRTRQNLALAYALAGDWTRARTVAAQDVSPAELNQRLQGWAAMARPAGQSVAVANLLGVTPVEDAGQPVRLALNASAAPVAYAEAAPASDANAPDMFAEADASAPVEVAAVEAPAAEAAPAEVIRYAEAPVVVAPAPAPVAEPAPVRFAAAPAPAPAPAAEPAGNWWPAPAESAPAPAPVQFASAEPAPAAADEAPAPAAVVAVLSAPSPVLNRTVAPALTARPVYRQAPINRAAAVSARLPRSAVSAASGNGNFVVQLGAFADAANAQRAWNAAQSRHGVSRDRMRTASVTMGGRQLTRVSVGGFANRAEAVRLCSSIQAQGGSCFVRGNAGDVPNVRWASSAGTGRRG
jgi:Flp pilus assembly protein TadD